MTPRADRGHGARSADTDSSAETEAAISNPKMTNRRGDCSPRRHYGDLDHDAYHARWDADVPDPPGVSA